MGTLEVREGGWGQRSGGYLWIWKFFGRGQNQKCFTVVSIAV